MTVLCGGISDGMLWDMVDVEVEGVTAKTLRPMVAMTAEDLARPGICSVCGKADDVICYPDKGKAYCPVCCGGALKDDGEQGHQYEHDRDERDWFCVYCGDPAPHDWMAGHWEDIRW